MKSIAAILLFAVSSTIATPALACWAALPNPQRDADTADAIFIGNVIAKRPKADGVYIRSVLTIASTSELKGDAPIKLTVIPGCGDHDPDLNERVIVIRQGKYNTIRRVGDPYERQLVAALRHGR